MPDALNYTVGPHPGCPFKCLPCQIYRVGPQPGGPLYVPDMSNNREGPQAREPSKHSIAGGAMEKDRPKRPSHHQLQEAQEKTDRAIPLAAEAVCVPAHLALPGSPQAKQPCHIHTQFSRGQRCHRQKKICIYVHRVASVMSHTLRLCRLWPARLLCQAGSPDKNTGVY